MRQEGPKRRHRRTPPGQGRDDPDQGRPTLDPERQQRYVSHCPDRRVFLDYNLYSNSPNNSDCAEATSPAYWTPLVNIVGGNDSSSCVVGWFVRYVTSGPVGTGLINNGEAIGVQPIR